MLHRVFGVAHGVLVAVQQHLEVGVVFFNQRFDQRPVRWQPNVGVVLTQGPVHDLQTLLDDPAVGAHQHRHRAFGRSGQHVGGLGFEADFNDRHRDTAVAQGHAGAHGVGAAAERVEGVQAHLTCTVLSPLPWR